MGSATEKNIKSIPIPAANNIADQLKTLNSGFDCSGPNLIFPKREVATKITKTIYNVAANK